MPTQVLLNIFIAILWMFFQDSWTILSFFSGYLCGLLIIFILRRYFKEQFYIFTLIAAVHLVLVFIWEALTSTIAVIKEIVRPKVTLTPGVFKLQTGLRTEVEITLISLLLTLTPGSVVMETVPEKGIIYLHGMDMPESEKAVMKSAERFEKAIKRVTRNE